MYGNCSEVLHEFFLEALRMKIAVGCGMRSSLEALRMENGGMWNEIFLEALSMEIAVGCGMRSSWRL